MMIAISARGVDLDAGVDVRSGRAAMFVLVDTDTGTARVLENGEASGAGAGIQAAQLMAANGVHVVLTGHCGRNAYRALHAAGVRVYTGVAEGTVREAVRQFQAGRLREAAGADVQPHW